MLNEKILAGFFIIILETIRGYERFRCGRINLILFTVLFTTLLNVIWVSFSDIPAIESTEYGKLGISIYFTDDLGTFDFVFKKADEVLTVIIYWMI